MDNIITIPGVRIITISGRIGAGSTSLAKHLAKTLGWKHIEGGEIFWEAVRKKMHLAAKDTGLRPDEEDVLFEKQQKKIAEEDQYIILETKLAGFISRDLPDVFRVVVLCENAEGYDQPEIRIDRLVNREQIPISDAKQEVFEREESDISKWRRLYAHNDSNWTYWDKKYYNLVVNTYSHNAEESLELVLEAIGYKKKLP
jgi:predicted cytidylate kinase